MGDGLTGLCQLKHYAIEVKVIGSILKRPVTFVSKVLISLPVIQTTSLIRKKWAKEFECSRSNL